MTDNPKLAFPQHQAMHMEAGGASEELEEVEAELAKKEEDGPQGEDVEDPQRNKDHAKKKAMFPQAFVQSFTLTFLAEWGDRSQIATIALAAAKDPIGVTLGGTLGHALCTGLAVIGGRMLAASISERMVAIIGGILFLVFAVVALIQGPEGSL